MGDEGRIIKGAIQALAWTNGAERLTVHMDGVAYHMTRNEYEAYLNGRRAGAEEMRERAASAAWTALEAVLFKENGHDTVLEDHIADTIRALPLEG